MQSVAAQLGRLARTALRPARDQQTERTQQPAESPLDSAVSGKPAPSTELKSGGSITSRLSSTLERGKTALLNQHNGLSIRVGRCRHEFCTLYILYVAIQLLFVSLQPCIASVYLMSTKVSAIKTCLQELARGYPRTSIFGMTKQNKFRRACIWLSRSRYFESLILLVILMNCITLAMATSREQFDDTDLGKGLAKVEYFFTAIFTLECTLKIVSMGFVFEKGTYLRNGTHLSESFLCQPSAASCM